MLLTHLHASAHPFTWLHLLNPSVLLSSPLLTLQWHSVQTQSPASAQPASGKAATRQDAQRISLMISWMRLQISPEEFRLTRPARRVSHKSPWQHVSPLFKPLQQNLKLSLLQIMTLHWRWWRLLGNLQNLWPSSRKVSEPIQHKNATLTCKYAQFSFQLKMTK